MAHNLAVRSDGKAAMAFAGGKPWHELGQDVGHAMTAEEAIAASINWKYELGHVFAKHDGQYIQSDLRTVQRTDTGDVTGIVSDRYRIVQPKDCFKFFDSVVGTGEAKYQTVGALGKGEMIWLLAELPGSITVGGKRDEVKKYILLYNGYDGKKTLRMAITPVRVVCQNTLNAAMRNSTNEISIRHVGAVSRKIDEARRVLGLADEWYKKQEEIWNLLAARQIIRDEAENFFKRVLPDVESSRKDANEKREDARSRMMTLFAGEGKGADWSEVSNTMWGAVNAVAEYADYELRTRGTDDQNRTDNHMKSVVFGAAAEMKQVAYDVALDMAQIKMN